MARAKSSTTALALGLVLMTLVGECYAYGYPPTPSTTNFGVGYYNGKCGKVNVEAIVFEIVKKHYLEDKDTVADLIRLQFHDCFVRGCDASILLEGRNTEKTNPNNLSVDGYDVIEDIKVALDRYCPGIVSCADIIVLAARSATVLGGAYWYDVETGRKDGRISVASEANQLPSRNIPIPDAVKLFARYGLDTHDFVYLLGCHTVGTAHCVNIVDRLYNFRNSGKPDPTMNKNLLYSLQKKCPRNVRSSNEAYLDQTPGSEFVMDNGFFKAILKGKGILKVDQDMALHPTTRDIVVRAANDGNIFKARIGPAMRKLGLVGVLTKGEVRLGTCRKVRY